MPIKISSNKSTATSQEWSAMSRRWSTSWSPWLMSSELILACVAVVDDHGFVQGWYADRRFSLPAVADWNKPKTTPLSSLNSTDPMGGMNSWSMVCKFSFFCDAMFDEGMLTIQIKDHLYFPFDPHHWSSASLLGEPCRKRFFLSRCRSRFWQRVMSVQYSYWDIATNDVLTISGPFGTSGTTKMSVTSLHQKAQTISARDFSFPW